MDDAIVVIENIERHIQEGERDPHKAASLAMEEVAGAVIATSLVLVAVFVPVAFFPGTTGILFRQFALTIAFSISISAFNALTLTPALSAILLGRTHVTKNWFFAAWTKSSMRITDGYTAGAARLPAVRTGPRSLLFLVGLGATYLVFQRVPKGFVPDEDQGYFIIAVQAPPRRLARIHEGHRPAGSRHPEATFRKSKELSPSRDSAFSGSASNQALIFVPLKPYSQRKGDTHTATAIVNRIRGRLFGISGAIVLPFLPPAVQGLGQFGGFQFEVQDQAATRWKNSPKSSSR